MAVSLLVALRFRIFKNAVDGCVDCLPLFEKFGEDQLAVRGEVVEALVALVFFAPLAYQQSLCFKAAQKRVERAFVDFQASFGKVLAERIAVMLLCGAGPGQPVSGCRGEARDEDFQRGFQLRSLLCLVHCTSHTV